MPMQRYMKVKGKPGCMVSNPWALGANPRRYAGKQLDAAMMGEPEHADRFRCVEEVLASHIDLILACTDGDLELLDKCVAMNSEEAAVKMVGDA